MGQSLRHCFAMPCIESAANIRLLAGYSRMGPTISVCHFAVVGVKCGRKGNSFRHATRATSPVGGGFSGSLPRDHVESGANTCLLAGLNRIHFCTRRPTISVNQRTMVEVLLLLISNSFSLPSAASYSPSQGYASRRSLFRVIATE